MQQGVVGLADCLQKPKSVFQRRIAAWLAQEALSQTQEAEVFNDASVSIGRLAS